MLIRKTERLVVTAFLTSWSQPCHLLSPILEEIRSVYQGRIDWITVDADSNPELGVCYEVDSLPTLLYFVCGRVCARHVGLTSRDVLILEIERILQDEPADSALAKQALLKTDLPGE